MRALSSMAWRWMGACFAALMVAQPSAFAQAEKPVPLTTAMPELTPGEWGWRVEQPTSALFRGAVNRDAAGGGAVGMLYPGGHALVALAAILTHAAINSAAREAEDKKLREDADKVLDPLREVLSDVTVATLDQGVKQHVQGSALLQGHGPSEASRRWTAELVPTLTLAQSARSWMLDVQVNLWNEPRATEPYAIRVVRVISDPVSAEQAIEYWRADGGVNLKRVVAGLMAEALDLSLSDRAPQPNAPQRTVRFLDGVDEKVERAAVLAKACGRVQFRSLREWLVSAPLPNAEIADAEAPACLVAKKRFQ
ncbi:MAG: hypothetical protein C4K60_02175 [Ideonella sp. MAG2]|nr:MAG: hypothetical protein C4K60_02175 [Ideonella sp. MAG2]